MSDMLQGTNLYKAVREIFDSSLRAADAGEAVRRTARLSGSILKLCDTNFDISSRPTYVVAIGKAAPAMALTLAEILGGRISGGVISSLDVTERHALESKHWKVFNGGHPLPDQKSFEAAAATFDLLRHANSARALIVFLISGGGSAMMEWPRDERITLADLQDANRVLVTGGASISEVNAVRRAFSAVKGGRLAKLAPHAGQVTLIVSDTNRGDEASVASGPTLRPPAHVPRALDVVEHYGLGSKLPASILGAIRESPVEVRSAGRKESRYCVIADNQMAIEAAAAKARELDFVVEIDRELNEQAIDNGCQLLVSRLLTLQKTVPRDKSACLISGGEFRCPISGCGIGGRNSETVLRLAIEFNKVCERERSAFQQLIAMSAGTDGIDGNSPAAGAIADETTVSRALSQGLDPEDFLARSDSFSFFKALDETIVTGPTGTNVRDVRILIASGAESRQ